jgi:hypothetical protein
VGLSLRELSERPLARRIPLAAPVYLLILREMGTAKRVVRVLALPPIHRHIPQRIRVIVK